MIDKICITSFLRMPYCEIVAFIDLLKLHPSSTEVVWNWPSDWSVFISVHARDIVIEFAVLHLKMFRYGNPFANFSLLVLLYHFQQFRRFRHLIVHLLNSDALRVLIHFDVFRFRDLVLFLRRFFESLAGLLILFPLKIITYPF